MRVQIVDWTVRGPEGLFLTENPGPKYMVILINLPEGKSITENYIDPLEKVLETGEISFHNDKSKKIKLTEGQMQWLKIVALLAHRVIKVEIHT